MAKPSIMDQRISCTRRTQAYAGDGSITYVDDVIFSGWCRVTFDANQSKAEGQATGQSAGSNAIVFEVRANPKTQAATTADVITWKGKQHNILAITPMPAGRPDVLRLSTEARADTPLTTPSA
jgi:hypothetical protein